MEDPLDVFVECLLLFQQEYGFGRRCWDSSGGRYTTSKRLRVVR